MKKSFFFLLFVLFCIDLTALNFKPKQHLIQTDLSYAAERGFERDEYLFSLEYFADLDCAKAFTGIQNYEKVFDFTAGSIFFPPVLQIQRKKSNLALGFEGIYHLQNQKDIALEQDFIFNCHARYANKKDFSFRYLIGYGRKYTNIYALPKSVGFLVDNTVMQGLLFDKKFKNDFEFHYYVKNFNMYRYYLFDFLIHNFGCSRIFKNNVKFAGDIELKFADQFTTTPYLSGLWFKFSIGYCFRPSTKK